MSDFLKGAIYCSGTLSFSRRSLRKTNALILRYHSVGEDDGPDPLYIDPSLSIPRRAFDRQMRFVRDRYTPVPLDRIVEGIRGERPLPPRPVAVTFDDGYRDNYVNAFPVLKEYGLPATFYITAGCVNSGEVLWTSKLRYYFMATRERSLDLRPSGGKLLDLSSEGSRGASFAYAIALIKTLGGRRGEALFHEIESRLKVRSLDPLAGSMMSWEEAREMSRAGMAMGAHTLTHPNLPGLPLEEAEAEIIGSKTLIEEKVKAPVHHFAYPNGRGVSHFNGAVREIVRKTGFASSVTSLNGPVRREDDPWTLRRMGVYRKHSRIFCLALDMERTRLGSRSGS